VIDFLFTRRANGTVEEQPVAEWFLLFALSDDGRDMIERLLQGRDSDAVPEQDEGREGLRRE